MARLVIKTANGPEMVDDKAICMCGLSSSLPFCDSSHKKTLDEDKETTYFYEGKERKAVAELVCDEEEATDCCGGSCGSCSCSHDEK